MTILSLVLLQHMSANLPVRWRLLDGACCGGGAQDASSHRMLIQDDTAIEPIAVARLTGAILVPNCSEVERLGDRREVKCSNGDLSIIRAQTSLSGDPERHGDSVIFMRCGLTISSRIVGARHVVLPGGDGGGFDVALGISDVVQEFIRPHRR